MKTIAVTVHIPADKLATLARLELGLEAPKLVPAGPVPAFHPRSDAVRVAIEHVIRATEKFNKDQYSPGEGSAATALFEAGKRLRNAVAEEKKAKSQRGEFHV